jgi:AhpD family alkylhydroperoxidase
MSHPASAVPSSTVSASGAEAGGPRLAPVRRSWNPLVWIAALAYRSVAGRVGGPVRVILARVARIIPAHFLLLATSEYGLSLDKRLKHLVRVLGSRVNDCSFCFDLESFVALKDGVTQDDLTALASFDTSPRFDARERAALRYVEEINRTRTASDEAFAALRAHFSEREIVEITWLNAVGNYLNLQARPLGLGSEGYCVVPQP